MTELREQLAAHVHEIWTEWMKYVFCRSLRIPGGHVMICADAVDRWMGQTLTMYDELTEEEKNSDRRIADGILDIIKQSGKKFCECGEKE